MRISRGVVAVLLSALCACGGGEEETPAPLPDHRSKVNGIYEVTGTIRVVQPNGAVETTSMRDTLVIANETAAPPGLKLTLQALGCGPRARMEGESSFTVTDTTCPLANDSRCEYSWNFREGQGTKPTGSTLQLSLRGKLIARCGGGMAMADLTMSLSGTATGQ